MHSAGPRPDHSAGALKPLDQTDREICAALLRNGRASWRQIADAIGAQERTVSRRGAKLLDSGLVRVKALLHTQLLELGDSYFAKFSCHPSLLRETASWLAHREETLWVFTLAEESSIIAECNLLYETRSQFIQMLADAYQITDYAFSHINRYRRTVRGWQPNILQPDVLEFLGENEEQALLAANTATQEIGHDATDLEIAKLLSIDGRLSIDAVASRVGLAKSTVRRRITQMQRSDYLSIRAVIDPATLGFPLESLITVQAPIGHLDRIGTILADDWHIRWAAELPSASRICALATATSHQELHKMLLQFDDRIGPGISHLTASPILTHYKRSDVVLPAAS